MVYLRATGLSLCLRTKEPGAWCLQWIATENTTLAQVEANMCYLLLTFGSTWALSLLDGVTYIHSGWLVFLHSIWWPTSSLEAAWQTRQEMCFSNFLCLSQSKSVDSPVNDDSAHVLSSWMSWTASCSFSLAGLFNQGKFRIPISKFKCYFRQLLLHLILPSAQSWHTCQTALLTALLGYFDLFSSKSLSCPPFLKDAES